MNRKLIFYIVWLSLLAGGIMTVLHTTPLSSAFSRPAVLVNFLQRILGLALFTLLFWQLMLGAFMQFWVEELGAWVFRFHIVEGVAIYILAFFHPFFFLLYNYFIGRGFDPFYVYVQVCVLCKNLTEVYYSLGRASFWLLNITVFAGLFRTANPFMQKYWRKFHVLNYLVFLLVGVHGFLLGTDFRQMPFFAFAVAAYLIVLFIVIVRKLPELFKFLF